MPLVSLFSGALGLDHGLTEGLIDAGLYVPTVCAVDGATEATIRANLGVLPVVRRDVTQVRGDDLLRETGLLRGETFVLTGGPPCQPFSTAGRRASLADPRGSLFREYVRLIADLRPRFFVMENVRGLLSAAVRHRPLHQRGQGHPPLSPEEQPGSAFQIVLACFAELGYTTVHGVLNAADYGVPQRRERLIIIGSRDGEAVVLPPSTHARAGQGGLEPWVTLREALAGLHDPAPVFLAYPESRLRYLRLVPEGGNWRSLPEHLHAPALGGAASATGGKAGFYRRLAWDKPAPTVTTSPSQKATDMCHPCEDRPISVREAARIQGFPDTWVFCGTVTQQYRQIGNAVPTGLSRAIGRVLGELARGSAGQAKSP